MVLPTQTCMHPSPRGIARRCESGCGSEVTYLLRAGMGGPDIARSGRPGCSQTHRSAGVLVSLGGEEHHSWPPIRLDACPLLRSWSSWQTHGARNSLFTVPVLPSRCLRGGRHASADRVGSSKLLVVAWCLAVSGFDPRLVLEGLRGGGFSHNRGKGSSLLCFLHVCMCGPVLRFLLANEKVVILQLQAPPPIRDRFHRSYWLCLLCGDRHNGTHSRVLLETGALGGSCFELVRCPHGCGFASVFP